MYLSNLNVEKEKNAIRQRTHPIVVVWTIFTANSDRNPIMVERDGGNEL